MINLEFPTYLIAILAQIVQNIWHIICVTGLYLDQCFSPKLVYGRQICLEAMAHSGHRHTSNDIDIVAFSWMITEVPRPQCFLFSFLNTLFTICR